jgi:hypothetical protein
MERGGQRRNGRTVAWVESVLSDVRFGVRMLRKSPTVTAAALISLALGIGVCIAAFSVLDTLILKPLPVRDPNRLVQLTYPTEGAEAEEEMFSQPLLECLRSATSARIELFGLSYQGVRPAIFSDQRTGRAGSRSRGVGQYVRNARRRSRDWPHAQSVR